MVNLCYEAKNWEKLNEIIVLLSKRRAQLKQAVTAMVQQASAYVDELDEPLKLSLIETLRNVSEGKMCAALAPSLALPSLHTPPPPNLISVRSAACRRYVEVERARLTRILSRMQEAKGDVDAARKTMQDTVVETLGGMDKREKTDFILEQVRLCLETGDFVRANIVSKKIQTKIFKDPELDDLKMRFYSMNVRYHLNSHNWLDVFRGHQAMWDSPSVQASEALAHRCLKLQVLYLVLSQYNNEQSNLMHTLSTEKMLSKLPMYESLLKLFITKEIFHYADVQAGIAAEIAAFGDFGEEEQALMLKTLHQRITQHNIIVIGGYYARVRMVRLAELLALPLEDAEKQLCEMVSDKSIYARIDRPGGVARFAAPKTPNELLNDWSGDISTLLNTLESTCHLIHKENMIHKVV